MKMIKIIGHFDGLYFLTFQEATFAPGFSQDTNFLKFVRPIVQIKLISKFAIFVIVKTPL